ncbi:MAG: tyrosinase family protein [Pyrinomonadaceae bacterium]
MKTTTTPVSNPTWYGDIRNMFDQTDIDHMSKQGLDLTSYDEVKNSASGIYGQVAQGNMPPPPNNWTSDQVATFLNWMTNNFPKGTPPQINLTALKTLGATNTATRIRKEITTLSATELSNLVTAFTAIKALDPTDLNSYFVQAGYHWLPAGNMFCQHHAPGYNPWHRAYLMSFENALRSVPGCEDVTLPYWDITTLFPDVLKKAPFDSYTLPQDIGENYNKGYVTQRYPYLTIQKNFSKYDVTGDINRALSKTDWEDFHGAWSGSANNTIIAAHDGGHNSIGPTMADQSVAAFDPVFWFFHANWDRLFWQWQTQMQATNLTGLLTTINKTTDINSYNIFTISVLESLPPFTADPLKLNTLSIIDSVNSLSVGYQNPTTVSKLNMLAKTTQTTLASQKFSVHTDRVNVSVRGLNRLKIPGSFSVHLLKDGKVIASKGFFQPNEVEKCGNCVENAVVRFDFELPLKTVSGGKLGIWVEPNDKSFVGDHFPHKLMGNPTVEVHLLMTTE